MEELRWGNSGGPWEEDEELVGVGLGMGWVEGAREGVVNGAILTYLILPHE